MKKNRNALAFHGPPAAAATATENIDVTSMNPEIAIDTDNPVFLNDATTAGGTADIRK